MKRCPNGSRKNKKGICVNKTQKIENRRCPNGSRKNKKGICVKMSISPKYYDISNKIDTRYEDLEYVTMDKIEFHNKIKEYLGKHKQIKTGDILFVGSHYETRQEYGFCLVIGKDVKFGEYGPNLPLKHKKELPDNIKYEKLLQDMKKDNELYLLWFGDDNSAADEMIELYKNNELY